VIRMTPATSGEDARRKSDAKKRKPEVGR
jgi:hypothetical protein